MPPLNRRISVPEFRRRIMALRADPPQRRPGIWYRTQKEHWLGWLRWYDTPGAYGRIPRMNRDARYAYNHIVCSPMLEWLIRAGGVERPLVAKVQRALRRNRGLHAQSAAIRRLVPFDRLAQALWPESVVERSVEDLRRVIRRRARRAGPLREQWLDWLSEYRTAGRYGRQRGTARSARFVFNHLHNAQMLLWLAQSAGIERTRIARAAATAARQAGRPAQAAAVRGYLPWTVVEAGLWR